MTATTEPTYRAPTVDEAVAWMLRHRSPLALSYRRRCLAHWKVLVGESFELKVRTEVAKRWPKARASA